MTRKPFIATTREVVDAVTEAVLSSTELRIYYIFHRGSPAVFYQRNGDPGWPADPDEIELDFVEKETSEGWVRVSKTDYLHEWATNYLEEHEADVLAKEGERDIDAAEYRAEMREDR